MLTLKNREISQNPFWLVLKFLDLATPGLHSYTATSSRQGVSCWGPQAHLDRSAHFHSFLGFVTPVFNSLHILQVTWDKDVFIKNIYPRLFVLSPLLGLTPGGGGLCGHVSSKHAWRARSRAQRVAI